MWLFAVWLFFFLSADTPRFCIRALCCRFPVISGATCDAGRVIVPVGAMWPLKFADSVTAAAFELTTLMGEAPGLK